MNFGWLHSLFFSKPHHLLTQLLLLFTILFLFTLGFILRVEEFKSHDYFGDSDWNKDYIMAHNIVCCGQMPLSSGGSAEGIVVLLGGPLYHYINSLLIAVKDDMLTLGWVNIGWQMLVLFMIFLLSFRMFGTATAIVVLMWTSTMPVFVRMAIPWQSHTMHPFLLVAYYLLYRAWKYKSKKTASFSLIIFACAGVLHVAAFVVTPIFLAAVFIIFRTQNRKNYIQEFVKSLVVFVSMLFILFLPRFYLYLKNGQSVIVESTFQLSQAINTQTNHNFIDNIYKRTMDFMELFFKSDNRTLLLLGLVIFAIVIAKYIYRLKISSKRGDLFTFLGLAICFYLLLSSLVNPPHSIFHYYYFIPIVSLFVIVLAEAIASMQKIWLIAGLATIMWLVFSPQIAGEVLAISKTYILNKQAADNWQKLLTLRHKNYPAAEVLLDEIEVLKNKHGYNNYLFFQMHEYARLKRDMDGYLTYIMRKLNVNLTRLNETESSYYDQVGRPDYVFVFCGHIQVIEFINESPCFDLFYANYPDYEIIKRVLPNNTVPTTYGVYLTKAPYIEERVVN